MFTKSKTENGIVGSRMRKLVGTLFLLSTVYGPLPTALAQNECDPDAGTGTDPADNDVPTVMADSYTCGDPAYPGGVTYSTSGDFSLLVPDAPSFSPDFGAEALNVMGNGADSVSVTSNDNLTAGGNTGPVLDVTSVTGAITIQAATIRGDLNSGAASHGIRAHSNGSGGGATDGGDIAITYSGQIFLPSANRIHGVEAVTAGGDIVITSNERNESGIFAQTEADGRVEIIANPSTGGVGSIDATSGTGGILLDLRNEVEGVTTNAPVLATIDIESEVRDGSGGTAIVSTGPQVLVNLEAGGQIGDRFDGISGLIDFTGITGSSEIRVGGFWNTTGDSDNEGQTAFGDGDDLIHILPGGLMVTGVIRDGNSDALDPATEIDFGGGDNRIINAGTIYIGQVVASESATSIESETSFTGLGSFENSGTIVMGSDRSSGTDSDGSIDDVLAMPGASFVGSGDSLVVMDIDLNGVGQNDCNNRGPDGDLVAADCIDLSNGSASGQTLVLLTEKFPGDRGAYNPDGNVLVDVSGGSGDPEAFVLHPDSSSYSPAFGGVIDKGFFLYTLAYDDANQQYKVFGVPGGPALQMPLLAHAAQSLWRTSAVSRFDRQRNLQAALHGDADPGTGLWFRVATESGERDVAQSVVAGIETFTFDNSYSQDSSALTMGVDFIANDSWVFGGQVGYVTSSLEYDESAGDVNFEGMSVGLYGSYMAGGFFVDALVNGNWLELDNDVPSLNLFPDSAILNSDLQSLGAQVEAGWSGLNFGRIGIEPLANLSYVVTDFDTIEVPSDDPIRLGSNVKYDDPVSFRGGLGVRLSVEDIVPGFLPIDVSLTTRAVNEFDGESKVIVGNLGPDAAIANEFEGTFTEVSGSVTVSNTAKTVAGYLNVDGTFESDYESVGAEVGFRYQW